jgi:hypothetical protein
LAVIFVSETATDGDDGLWEGLVERPAGDVHLVNALVSDIAVAEFTVTVPVVMEAVLVERAELGSALPEIVIDAGRDLAVGKMADAGTRLVAEAAGEAHFADVAVVNVLDALDMSGIGAGLGAGLADAVEFEPGLFEAAAFGEFVADGLFDIDILAGLHGPNGGEGVPGIWDGDGNGIDGFVFEQLADVGVLDGFRAAAVLQGALRWGESALIDVAEGDDLDAIIEGVGIEMVFAAAVQSDDGEADARVGGGARGWLIWGISLGGGFGLLCRGEAGGGDCEGVFEK